MAIVAPASANALDIAAPMPREPPVTSAVRSRNPLLIALSAIGKHCTLVGRAVTASSAQNFLQFGGAIAERRGAQEEKRKMFGNLSYSVPSNVACGGLLRGRSPEPSACLPESTAGFNI